MKTAKISDADSFLEVIDAPTGETVGGVLAQHGVYLQFDAVFSAGDCVAVISNGKRFSVYALSSGRELVRSFALNVALSGDGGLFALAEEHGLLSLYNLKTAAKVGEYNFPYDVVYAHFSQDEGRLLAVTRHQSVYILDVSGLTAALPRSQ